jgi:putative glutamine amidotransferase
MKDKKPRIGITLRVENIEEYDEKRDAISQEWVNFIEKFDGIPIFIPNMLKDTKSFLQELELDGLVLSGGDNKGDDPYRDRTEQDLIEYGIKNKIPILGVCRGMQVINDYFGGSYLITKNNNHVAKNHDISITDKKIEKCLGIKKMEVNSFHHNVILEKNLGKNLKVFAKSINDNTIEGLLHEELPIIGVMWHPEREKDSNMELKLMNMFHIYKIG